VRWEVLAMMALLGLVNLIGRWLSARAEARKRTESAESQAGAVNPRASAPPARRVVARVEPRPVIERPKRREPANVEQRASPTAVSQKPAAPVPDQRAAAKRPVLSISQPALVRKRRWTSKSLRQAFIASEILASPVSARS
jgi:hypothetical protein